MLTTVVIFKQRHLGKHVSYPYEYIQQLRVLVNSRKIDFVNNKKWAIVVWYSTLLWGTVVSFSVKPVRRLLTFQNFLLLFKWNEKLVTIFRNNWFLSTDWRQYYLNGLGDVRLLKWRIGNTPYVEKNVFGLVNWRN